ncbi:RNA-binding protein [Candidatus Woesearchaeota archaeon]|nr:RNA-binding protein [Candidatus Woesearchaeota archaeon]|tara:strand:+ start:11280 stop:12053 length:774 start_codon:yes stop_codon:yes gene_type:complete
MNSSIREHILKALDAGIRFDGRKLDELRKVTVEKNVSKNAEGSARVLIGDTEILAGVKTAVEQPYPDSPEEGNLMVNAELLPLSNSRFEPGPPSEEAIEVARIIDRGIREANTIDRNKLCLTPKEEVWSVMIDVLTINAHGNLIDASAFASIVALLNAKLPKREDGVVNYSELTKESIPLSKNIPITVTVYKIGKHLIVDPLPEEEDVADARLTAAVLEDGSVVAMQKGGEQPITADEILAMASLAQTKSKELRKLL